MASDKKTVAVVLFGGFELLDVAAPVEFFGALGSDVLELCYCRLPDSPEEEAPSYPQHDAHVAGWRECAHICSLPIDEAIAFATPYAFGRPFADYDINREEQAQAREPTPEDLLSSAVSSSCLELRGGSSGPDFVTTHVLSDNGTITSNDGTRFHPNIVFVPGESLSLSLSPLAWTNRHLSSFRRHWGQKSAGERVAVCVVSPSLSLSLSLLALD